MFACLLCLPARRLALWVLVAAAAALAGCGQSAPPAQSFHSVDISGGGIGQDWEMPNADGTHTALQDLHGQAVFLYFGYAQCPDVCPTTMLEMTEVKRLLGEQGQRLRIVFATVDPERDTPEIMKAYLHSFDPDAIALVGDAQQVAALTRDFRVTYEKVPGPTPASYTINHTAGGFLYDPQGRLRLYAPYGTPASKLAEDVRVLLEQRS